MIFLMFFHKLLNVILYYVIDIIDVLVGNGSNSGSSQICVPFVSAYTDCTEENLCTGCSKCVCTADAKWDCNEIHECADTEGGFGDIDENDIDEAIKLFNTELKKQELKDKANSEYPLVPEPEKLENLLLEVKEVNVEDEILELMRSKRSIDEVQGNDRENDTIKFYHAVDELNEDTLKELNVSGTLPVQKINTVPQVSKKTSMLNNSSNLQIEYTKPKENKHHNDNKVDTLTIHDDKEDLLVHGNVYDVIGNHSQNNKDQELSKLLVNELKEGISETIGDDKAPVISNITFTPENDTLTAMAFIAGNLLNKLWSMEKDASDDQIDTEVLKHEKIADLLDLFKEPLSMRQEKILKNALEQISTALNQNKDADNISLCKNLEINKLLDNIKENKPNDQVKTDVARKNAAATKALDKINNVLDLIKKFENVQNRLDEMKSATTSNKADIKITEDEKSSLDLYGKTLETITKLLIPHKNNKKIVNSLQNGNLFKTEKDLKNTFSDIKLDTLNITAKDKMILDYLAHVQSNPDCLLKKHQKKASQPSIEGNILLNLSEFFKIKSLSDLVKLVEPEKRPNPVFRSQTVTTQKPVKKLTTESIVKDSPKQFKDTKQKLKGHLKSILEDLEELQKIEGKDSKNKDIQIMEALPCIYNLLNAGKKEVIKPKTTLDKTTMSNDKTSSEKIQEIFSNLKKELKFAQTRRMSASREPRPKSAVVWERVIKNTQGKQKLNTRRNLGKVPKTIEELNVFVDKIDSSGSNTYKTYAYLNEVPPAEKLLLLKTFNADTMRYVKALETIMASLQAKSSIPKDGVKEINEFIDNAAVNINLNEKVIKNLDKPKKVYDYTYTSDPKKPTRNKEKLEYPINTKSNSYGTKLTKDQIINQLIKNRILLYVETKEAAQETRNDMNYNVAKKILLHLELGNFEIARELYKVFTSLKQQDDMNTVNKSIGFARAHTKKLESRRRPLQVEPIIKFENPKTINNNAQMVNQDSFIKQLLNLKNMKL